MSLNEKAPTGRGSDGGALNIPPMPKVITARELERMMFPEPVWLVPGMIPEGITLLAGKPKLGKSYLALNIALALACGGRAMGTVDVSQRGVLYLSLEDRQRRLQRRIRETFSERGWPTCLHLCTEWPRVDQGGITLLSQYLDQQPDIKLIIVDVLMKFRARSNSNNSGVYSEDYRAMEPLVAFSQTHDVSIIVLHHTRKLVADDPLDEISGSTGLSGSVDTVLVLKRIRGQAVLYVRGRDVEEQELALKRDPSGGWLLIGTADQVKLSEDQKMVMTALNSGPMRLTAIAGFLGKSKSTVHYQLDRLMADGKVVQRENGLYEVISYSNSSNTSNISNDSNTSNNTGNSNCSKTHTSTFERANQDTEPDYSVCSNVRTVRTSAQDGDDE